MRKLKLVKNGGLFLLAFSLVVSSSWAGTTHVNYLAANNPAIVALEALGAARNVDFQSPLSLAGQIDNNNPGEGALTYEISQNLTSGNLVRLTLTGAQFTGNAIYVGGFDPSSGSGNNLYMLSFGTPGVGTNTYNFQIQIPAGVLINAGNNNARLVFTNDVIAAAGGLADASNLMFQFPITTIATNPTVTVDIVTSGGLIVDTASTAQLATITRERTVTLNTSGLTIDYVNSPFDGTLFRDTGNWTARNMATNDNAAFNIVHVANDYGIGAAANNANAGLTARAVVNFDNTNNWQGVSRLWIGDAIAGCPIASNISNVVTSPAAAVALNVSAAAWNQAVAGNYSPYICIETVGNAELQPRPITGSVAINISSGGTTQAATFGTFQTWTPNGFQSYIPHMRYSSTTRGFIRLVNNGARDAQLKGVILKTDGTTIPSIDMGTLQAGRTMNISAQTLGQAQGLGDEADYALQITATVTQDSVFADCFFNLLSGGVWTTRNNTLYENWKQTIPNK